MSTRGRETMVEWLLQRSDIEERVTTFFRLPNATRPIKQQAEDVAREFAEMRWQQDINAGRPLSHSMIVNVRRKGEGAFYLFSFAWTVRALTIRP